MSNVHQGQRPLRSLNLYFYERKIGGDDILCPICSKWRHYVAQCIYLKVFNKCGIKGQLGKSCNQKSPVDRSKIIEGIHRIDLIEEGLSDSLVLVFGSFMEDVAETGHIVVAFTPIGIVFDIQVRQGCTQKLVGYDGTMNEAVEVVELSLVLGSQYRMVKFLVSGGQPNPILVLPGLRVF